MWGNISGVVGAAISKVQEIQTELESQLDAAVNVEEGTNVIGVNKRPSPKNDISEESSSQTINIEKETTCSKAIGREKIENTTTKISSSTSVDSFYASGKIDKKFNEGESQLSEITLESKSPKIKLKGKSIKKSTSGDNSITNLPIQDNSSNNNKVSVDHSTTNKPVNDNTSNNNKVNEKALLQQSHRAAAELENVHKINNKKIFKMKEEFENEIFELNNKHKIELEDGITTALEKEKSDYLEELSNLRTFWSAEKDELNKQIKTIEEKNLDTIESIKKSHENKLLKQLSEHKKEIDELMNKTSSQSSENLATTSAAIESKQRLEDKMKLANSRISELEMSLKESRVNLDIATKSSIDSSSLLVEIKQNSEKQLLLANTKINELKQTLDSEIKNSADLAEIELNRTINQLQILKDNVTELEAANLKSSQSLLEKSSSFQESQNNLERQIFTSNNKIKELETSLLDFQQNSNETNVKAETSSIPPVKGQKLKIALDKISELELQLIDSNSELLNEKKKMENFESDLLLSTEKVFSLSEKNKISNDKINDINKELKILSIAKDSSDDQVKSLQIEFNNLEIALSKSQNEVFTFKDEVEDYKTLLSTSDDTLKASLYKISELEMSQKNSTEEEQSSNDKIEQFEISIQNYKVEIANEIQNKKEIEEQLETLEDQLDAALTRIEKVESSLRSAHNNSKIEKEELNKQLLKFEEKTKISSYEINRLNELCIQSNKFEEENKLIQIELLDTKNKLIELNEELSNNKINKINEENNDIMIELKNNLKLLEEKNESSFITIEKQENMILELNKDIKRQSEIVSDRERSLESLVIKMSEAHKILEQTQRKLSDLQDESKEKDNRLHEMQTASVGDADMKKLVSKLQDSVKEKHEQLAEFQSEGQILAKKQSDMEKGLRKKNGELKEKDKEIDGLKESKIQLNKAIEEMSELVRKHENESSVSLKSLNAMQAVSQASSDKVSKIEIELNTKHDEIVNQKRALETSWAECNELKRSVQELKAERDDLRKQIGEGTSNMRETESSRRDIEQREAVLRATSKQLQESLQRQMQESSGREERLREEVNEMRKRWHDAITSRDSLAADLGSATAPLLRQISSLQEGIRSKTESWQILESSLSERALRAESASEIAEHKKAILDEQLLNNKQQITSISNRLNDALINVQTNEDLVSKCKRVESNNLERVKELESKLSLESGHKQSLQTSLKELESRYKLDIQDSKECYDSSSKKFEKEISNYEEEIKELRSQLMDIQTKQQKDHNNGRNVKNINKDFDITIPVKSKSYSGLPETLPSKY
jgi:chromosome segregation ATPase